MAAWPEEPVPAIGVIDALARAVARIAADLILERS
jgi:hypothetical protein